MLAELAAPTYVIHALDDIEPDHFYDERHKRCFRAIKNGAHQTAGLSDDDRAYLDNAVRFAWPLSPLSLDSFLDCATKRRRLFELEAERLELLGISA